ncbi:hypothetical protein [Paraburkholderia ferrariae]|uniref:hypothetical protein n=1 Tax=Paraburkholderia ferrariae TaxID=386056 RepID=UPI0005A6EE9E|nr:hypothetical protein [Paraburkholderia ferrariae]
MPARSFPDFGGVTSGPPQDDRLSVLFGLSPPWRLSLDAGRWLRRLSTVYEDQLALRIFVRAQPLVTTGAAIALTFDSTAGLAAGTPLMERYGTARFAGAPIPALPNAPRHDALLRRLRRLRLPAGVLLESRHGPVADAAFAGYRSFSRWTLLQATALASGRRPADAPVSGIVVRSDFYRPDRPNRLLNTPCLVDFGPAAEGGLADRLRRIASLADALAESGDGRIAGVIIGGLDQFNATPQTSRADVAPTLDLLANAVEHRRLARATRRPHSLWSRL